MVKNLETSINESPVKLLLDHSRKRYSDLGNKYKQTKTELDLLKERVETL